MTVATTLVDRIEFAALRSSPMAATYGQRLISAVVPRFWKDLTALQRASGRAYSTIHDWSSGKSNPRLEQLDELARLIEREHGVVLDPLELVAATPGPIVVPDDRYPSRARVLVALDGLVDAKAKERVATQANFGSRDPGPLYWIEALARAQREIETERALGVNPEHAAGAAAFERFAAEDAERAERSKAELAAAQERKRKGE